jgi:carbon-monoxide dehydrogenase large subunit
VGSILGNRVERVEDRRFLTTGGNYVGDVPLPGAAHVVFVRSPYAHALIESVDVTDAAALPGVLRVFTAADLDGLDPAAFARQGVPEAMRFQLLAVDRVRYVGEPVAAVVAETVQLATDAADLVMVEYEPLPVVIDVEHSVRDETSPSARSSSRSGSSTSASAVRRWSRGSGRPTGRRTVGSCTTRPARAPTPRR